MCKIAVKLNYKLLWPVKKLAPFLLRIHLQMWQLNWHERGEKWALGKIQNRSTCSTSKVNITQDSILSIILSQTNLFSVNKIKQKRQSIRDTGAYLLKLEWLKNKMLMERACQSSIRMAVNICLKVGFENHPPFLHCCMNSCFNHVINDIHHTIVLRARSLRLADVAWLYKTRISVSSLLNFHISSIP